MELDPGDDFFTVARARNADHLHISNSGVSEEEFFQLTRVNVLTTTDDHVLVAPDDADVTLFVHARQVAGVHPTVPIDGVGGALGVVPVTEHHAVATGTQLADGATGNDIAGLVDDLAFQLRLGTANGGHAQFQFV